MPDAPHVRSWSCRAVLLKGYGAVVDAEQRAGGGAHRDGGGSEETSTLSTATEIRGTTDVDDASGSPQRRNVPRDIFDVAGDLAAMVLLLGVTWYWARQDGGRVPLPLAQVGLVALATVPFAVGTLKDMPRGTRWLITAWALGALTSFALAAERSLFSMTVTPYAILPFVAIATYRLLRRPWGAVAVVVALLLGFGQYWYEGFLSWWGHLMMDRPSPWSALSYYNQTGALMAGFGLLFTGLAIQGRRVAAIAGGVMAPLAFAAVWLSSSRGSVIAALVGLLVVILSALKDRGATTVAIRSLFVLSAAAIVVVALLGFDGGYAGQQPLSDRPPDAGQNFARRFLHMEAAADMFLDRPISGYGFGSYTTMAVYFTEPGSNLTSHAHNELLESFAEGGLLFGVPLTLLFSGAAFGVVRWLRRSTQSPDDERQSVDVSVEGSMFGRPLASGAAGMVTALGLRSVVDFDWEFPVLPVLFVVGITIIYVSNLPRSSRPRRPASGMAGAIEIVPAAGLLLVGIFGLLAERAVAEPKAELTAEEYATEATVPWDSERLVTAAMELSAHGDEGWAHAAIDRAIAWNPGHDSLRIVKTIISYREGTATGDDLIAILRRSSREFVDLNRVAEILVEGGDYDLAEGVLDDLQNAYPRYTTWGLLGPATETWKTRMTLVARRDGCDAAWTVLSEALDDPLLAGFELADPTLRRAYTDTCPRGST